VLKDCEAALEMANNETDKANKVARDAKEDKISGLSDKVWNSVPLKLRL
jgi:hypothetical protein